MPCLIQKHRHARLFTKLSRLKLHVNTEREQRIHLTLPATPTHPSSPNRAGKKHRLPPHRRAPNPPLRQRNTPPPAARITKKIRMPDAPDQTAIAHRMQDQVLWVVLLLASFQWVRFLLAYMGMPRKTLKLEVAQNNVWFVSST